MEHCCDADALAATMSPPAREPARRLAPAGAGAPLRAGDQTPIGDPDEDDDWVDEDEDDDEEDGEDEDDDEEPMQLAPSSRFAGFRAQPPASPLSRNAGTGCA
jgi:hypothetical protein